MNTWDSVQNNSVRTYSIEMHMYVNFEVSNTNISECIDIML